MDADSVSLLQHDTILQDDSKPGKLKPKTTTNEELLQEIKALRESQQQHDQKLKELKLRHDQELEELRQQLSSVLVKPEDTDADKPALFPEDGLIADSADDEKATREEQAGEGQCAFCYSCGGDFPKIGGKFMFTADKVYGLGKNCAQPQDPEWNGMNNMAQWKFDYKNFTIVRGNKKKYKSGENWLVQLCCKA
jgi:hypothetical protein